MKVHYIESFQFKAAEYIISDGKGAEFILQMDYRNNSFEIQKTTNQENALVLNEAIQIAQDLLARKHGKNFAEKQG